MSYEKGTSKGLFEIQAKPKFNKWFSTYIPCNFIKAYNYSV